MTGSNAIKVLTFTTLYPNAVQPTHGIFVENRLRHLLDRGEVETRVIAPVPWFPLRAQAFRRYAEFARVARFESRNGIEICHPRYPVIPKIGMSLAPFLLYRASRGAVNQVMASGFDFDLIDAHYFYPDGVAAVLLGRYLGKPVVVTARGTDINLIPRYLLPRRMIRWAARNAAGVIAVAAALKDELTKLGVNPEKIQVLPNGVDLSVFQPLDLGDAREILGLGPPLILSVGHLIAGKGHDLVIRALSRLSDVNLVIVGEGRERPALQRLAEELGVNERVRFAGSIDHERLGDIYSAADALVLASEREGWPNVLVESMACGTPVVASRVGAAPEIVGLPAAGILLSDRRPETIAASVKKLLRNPPDRAETRAYAEQFDWGATTQGQMDLFRDILSKWKNA